MHKQQTIVSRLHVCLPRTLIGGVFTILLAVDSITELYANELNVSARTNIAVYIIIYSGRPSNTLVT